MPACWLNGSLVPPSEARISVFDHGLLYGDGVFEGIRYYSGVPFRLDEHLERLDLSARAIALDLPYSGESLAEAVALVIDAFGHPDGYIRVVVTRGDGKLGIDPRSCPRASAFVVADQLSLVPEAVRRNGARLIIAATRRLPLDGLDPRIKSLNYLNHILARIEANQVGADEAVLLNNAGCVTEGSAENIFIVANGALLTPPTSDGALEGITRGVVLELAGRLGIPSVERSLAPYDLYTADECFLAGTGAELIAVSEVSGRPLRSSGRPVFSRLQQAFGQLVAEETGRGASKAPQAAWREDVCAQDPAAGQGVRT